MNSIETKIIWHKCSLNNMPPLNIPILITDGEIITVTILDNSSGYIDMGGCGFGGWEWEYDFEINKITWWALLPNIKDICRKL